MAEEASKRLFDVVDEVEESGADGPLRPTITEVALAHAERSTVLDLTDDAKSDGYEGNERILVDLTLVDEAQIEVASVVDVATPLDTTVPFVATAGVSTNQVIDLRPLENAPTVEAALEAKVEAPRDVSRSGLAVANRLQLLMKRATDIVLAALTLVLLTPLLVAIALIVATTSKGPVLYRSTRVGKDGKHFTFLKFRSMYDDADERLGSLKVHNEQSGPVFKIKDDPRITRIGRVIRRASVDELPQLVHVLAGHMSLVGPRPALVEEADQYDDVSRQRLLVKPGITCIWQVSGRSTIAFDRWVQMDLDYIESWSWYQDVRLLAKTIPAVVSTRGAY